jgi:predicted NAD-dependent protein-ADP-ribosyltransferase YbiA (DUF1768 family)
MRRIPMRRERLRTTGGGVRRSAADAPRGGRRRGAAAQAAKFRDERVVGWIAEAATVGEARAIAREYGRAPFLRPDFRAANVADMYRIVLAKFAQNPRLGRWLAETDPADAGRPGDMPPIFHTDEGGFWGLGPLGPPAAGDPAAGEAGDSGPAEVYSGQNLNGQARAPCPPPLPAP